MAFLQNHVQFVEVNSNKKPVGKPEEKDTLMDQWSHSLYTLMQSTCRSLQYHSWKPKSTPSHVREGLTWEEVTEPRTVCAKAEDEI